MLTTSLAVPNFTFVQALHLFFPPLQWRGNIICILTKPIRIDSIAQNEPVQAQLNFHFYHKSRAYFIDFININYLSNFKFVQITQYALLLVFSINVILLEVKYFLLHAGEHYERIYSSYTLLETLSWLSIFKSDIQKDLEKILKVMRK